MDTLPTEIVIQILDNLPTPAIKQARLTSRTFNSILAKRTFEILVSFLDPEVAQDTIVAVAQDPVRRHRRPSIWSPRCSVPRNLPVDSSFLMALWVGLRGDSWVACVEGDKLDVGKWKNGVGKDMSEDELRGVLFRYALYLSYMSECEKEQDIPQAWVLNLMCGKTAC